MIYEVDDEKSGGKPSSKAGDGTRLEAHVGYIENLATNGRMEVREGNGVNVTDVEFDDETRLSFHGASRFVPVSIFFSSTSRSPYPGCPVPIHGP